MKVNRSLPAILLFYLIVTLSPTVLAAESVLAPHLLTPEAYSETYNVVLELESGIHLQIQFAITNIGIGDEYGMCRVLYVDQEEAWNQEKIRNRQGWAFLDPERLDIGNCTFEAHNDATFIFAEIEQGGVEVKLNRPLMPVKPPGHMIRAGEEFFDLRILLPWAPAVVRLDFLDHPARYVSGYGIIYQFWVTAWPADLARQWIRVFAADRDGSFLLMSHFPPYKTRPPAGSIWLPDEPLPTSFDMLVFDTESQQLSVSRGRQTYRLTLQQQLYRHAPLEDLGFLGRIIRLFMGNWVTRTHRAVLEMPGRKRAIPAIVEITVDE